VRASPSPWVAYQRGNKALKGRNNPPRPPVHRMVRGLRSSAVVAPLDDRRPVGGASSYRAAAAVASIFFASRVRSPIRASHRRDDSVPREEPHVLFVRVAFALKGPDISAQGKATRVVRASPSPWVAYQRGNKALKGRDNRGIGLCRPFRASGPIRTTTRGGATLCPGLICPCPFGTQHRSPEDSERWRDRPYQPRAASTPNEPDDRERERGQIRSKPATSGRERLANGVFSGPRGLPTNADHRGRADDCSIFEDVVAASGASDGSSFRAGCGPPPVGDRRPARLRSSYRAGRNLASIGSGMECGQATRTPGGRCVRGDVGGFDAIPGAGSPGFFGPGVFSRGVPEFWSPDL
jgi:hypothetical protein